MKKLQISLNEMPLYLKIIFLIGVISFVTVLIPYIINFGINLTDSNEKWGQFGDYFGGILNPVLSFLSFSALVYTIILQRIEISNTLDEIKTAKSVNTIYDIIEIIKIISSEIDKSIRDYVKDKGSIPNKLNNLSHPIYFKIEENVSVIYKYLQEIEKLNKDSVYLEYYKLKYKPCVEIMYGFKYFDQNIYEFFIKEETPQGAC